MVENDDLTEGCVLEWATSNSRKRGYLTGGDDGRRVVLEDGHSFRLEDVASSPSLRVVGHCKVK